MKELTIRKNDLIQTCRDGFKAFQLKDGTVTHLMCGIRDLYSFMEEHSIDVYTKDVGELFRAFEHEQYLTKYCLGRNLRSLFLLNLLVENKPYKAKPSYAEHLMYGDIGEAATAFILYLDLTVRVAAGTLTNYRRSLSTFSSAMKLRQVKLSELIRSDILAYIASAKNTKPYILVQLRAFLHYLFEEGKTSENFSEMFNGIRSYRREKLPSYYAKEDILKLEASVNRESAMGKRDYAMIMLASRLGLRSSDIRSLQFSSIDWDNNLIKLKQNKTKDNITLPLLVEVGEAIIDYITNGRPQSKLKSIFLSSNNPYREITGATFTATVERYVYKAGIEQKNKHNGPHSLRHSLATNLLHNGTGLPIISATLGHSTTLSTMVYLGVDVNALLDCSHAVPPVDQAFYMQKGGILYE